MKITKKALKKMIVEELTEARADVTDIINNQDAYRLANGDGGDDSSSSIRYADITAPPHWAARMAAIIAKTG